MLKRTVWLATVVAFSASPVFAQQPAKPPPEKPGETTVGEVKVEGAAPPVRTSIDRTSYDVSKDLQATTGSIADALRNVPSVEVDPQGNLSLRGDPNVTILIDGKPSGMFRGEGKSLALQSLPANQIERVEVITNPSAAFSPEGTAGVINLVTKKVAKPGLNGGVRANAGTRDRWNGGANVSYRNGRLTLSGDGYGRRDTFRQDFSIDRTFADPSGPGQASDARRAENDGEVRVASVRLGAEYDLDDQTRLSADARYQGVNFRTDQVGRLDRRASDGSLLLGYDDYQGQRQDRDDLETTLGYRRKFGDDHELSLTFVSEWDASDRSRAALRQFRAPAAADTFEVTENRTHFWRGQVKADYARPLPGEVKLKVGYQLDIDDDDYRIVFARGPANEPLTIDPTRSNLFRFDQQIHAAYVTYERPFDDLTVLAGLRVEATRIDLEQVTQGLRDDNNYVRAYPSLHLNYRLGDAQKLTASYSRRVSRPGTQDYNAFRVYQDPQNQFQGNPDLKPQRTDSFELGYQRRKDGRILLATLYYRNGRDQVNDVYRDIGGGVILQTKENIGSFQSAGLELVASGRLPARFSYNVSANMLWSEIDGSDLGFGARSRSAYTASGRASLSWQATDKDFLQLQGFMNGKRLLTQGYAEPMGGLNLGYRHKFSDRLSGVVTVQDALDTLRVRQRIDTPNYSERVRGDLRNRAAFVGLTYTFGGGRPREPGFDFGSGGAAPGS